MEKLKTLWLRIKTTIAFYPSLISLAGISLALLIIYFEKQGISSYLVKVAPSLVIEDTDTARTLLSAFIGGLISLMVFSFSMVMILLNQASSNFSPRVLPGLISNKKHQVVLGLYLSAILYNIFALMFIEPTKNEYQTPGFLVLIGVILTIICLCWFIYFIHNISEFIQINNILKRIYRDSKSAIENHIDARNQDENYILKEPDATEWNSYSLNKNGYYQEFLARNLAEVCKKNDCKIFVTLYSGQYILNDKIAFKCNKTLNEDTLDKIKNFFIFSDNEFADKNFAFGFKQITEIAVKAMSPGINDPGTAINAIDYLTHLFSLLSQVESNLVTQMIDGKALVFSHCVNFENILYYTMASLRQYCRHDAIVIQKLTIMLSTILRVTDNQSAKKVLKNELKTLMADAKTHLNNERDFKKLKELAD